MGCAAQRSAAHGAGEREHFSVFDKQTSWAMSDGTKLRQMCPKVGTKLVGPNSRWMKSERVRVSIKIGADANTEL